MLLIILLIFSVNYIYQKVEQLTQTESYEQQLNEQRQVTYHVLSHLYQAEIIGQSVSAGQWDEYDDYRRAMKHSRTSLDSLQKILTDSIQAARLDTVSDLLRQKEVNMYNLLRAIVDANTGQIYHQKIERVIHSQDTTIVKQERKIQKRVIVHENTYVVKKKRPGFFKRIAQVFAPPKEDSTLVTNKQQEMVTDSLINAYNPADSVATILRTIQTQVNDSISQIQDDIQLRINRFKHNGWELSAQMNKILHAFEQEEQSLVAQKLVREQNIRSKSIRAIAVVAVAAIVLVVLFLFLIERDFTRSNHYRNELEKAKRKAENLLVVRERLMLTITHDIKAPVGSILGYIDLLMRLLQDERQRFYLNNMKSSARHLLDLVSSLLDFHRLESHKMEVSRVAFNPCQLFDTIYTSFQPLAEKKHLYLRYQPDTKLDRMYLGDPFRIRQIADNLLSNALKFTNEGGITLTTALTDGKFQFTVADTGSGISTEEQKQMFQEFTRLKNAQGEEGFGLGLAITQRLIVLMGGEIRVESTKGKGSSFSVALPLRLSSENAPRTAASQPTSAPQSPHKPLPKGQTVKLLLIDDDRIQLELTKAMLADPQLETTSCDNPETLLKLVTEKPYDILFTDIQMPAMNGFELLKHLRQLSSERARHIPVIALTARSDMDEQEFTKQGFAGCLHKPYTKTEVMNLLTRLTGWAFEVHPIQAQPTAQSRTDAVHEAYRFDALTAFSADDPEATEEIMRSFIEETQHNRDNLEEALQKQDTARIRAIAHKQLPLFTMLEANACLPQLKGLEREPYEVLNDSVMQRVQTVLHEMDKIITAARQKVRN